MNAAPVIKYLELMRQKYREIRYITSELSDDSTDEEFQLAVLKRGKLLSDAQNYQSELNNRFKNWKEVFKDNNTVKNVSDEVELLILRVLSKDESLQEILQSRLNGLRNELQNLGKKSKATMAYASNMR